MPSSRAIASRCSTPFVEPPLAAIDGGGVVERLARDDVRGTDVVAHEPHRQHAGLVGGLLLRRVQRRDPVQAGGGDAEEVERHRHRVRGELAAARAGARAGDALERMHLGAAHRARRVRADRLEDVLDRDVGALVAAGRDRAVVERRARAGRAARAPSPRPGSSCRSRRGRRGRRTGARARRARSSRRSPRARRATRACPRSPSRRRPRRRSC